MKMPAITKLNFVAEVVCGDEDSVTLRIHKDVYGIKCNRKYANAEFMVLIGNKVLSEYGDKLLILGSPNEEAIKIFNENLVKY